MTESEFEKGKKALVEGITGFMDFMRPYLLVHKGLELLGIKDPRNEYVEDTDPMVSADIWELAFNQLLSELKQAKSKEEVGQALENHRNFIKRLF